MYKEENREEKVDDDIELIADVGYIASSVRILEQKFFGGYLNSENGKIEYKNEESIGIKEDFKYSLGTINKCEETINKQQESNKNIKINTDSVAVSSQLNLSQRIILLEDLLIKFYEDRTRAKHVKIVKGNIMSKSELKSAISDNKIESVDNNTKYAQNQSKELKTTNSGEKDVLIVSRSEGNIENSCVGCSSSSISIGGDKIDDGDGNLKIKENVRTYFGDSNESGIRVSSIILSSSDNPESTSSINEYKLIRLENTLTQCTFNDDDLKTLVKDLKRKIEYTERMNWLYLQQPTKKEIHKIFMGPK